MKILRTPEEKFEDLDGYPFEPNYAEVADGEGGRMPVHYVDEVPKNSRPKGQPHTILEGGGHFLQEDLPEEYSEFLVNWLKDKD